MEQYRKETFDLESLIAFPLRHCVFHGGEYTDLAAGKVYREKAEEYLTKSRQIRGFHSETDQDFGRGSKCEKEQ